MQFLSFSDNVLQDKHVTFQQQKSVDNFEIAHKTCSISVWRAFPQMYVIVRGYKKCRFNSLPLHVGDQAPRLAMISRISGVVILSLFSTH